MIDREELRRLCEAATPGPWEVEPVKGYCEDYVVTRHADHQQKPWGFLVGEFSLQTGHARQNFTNDARFAAAARTALPALLDALEEQEAMTSALNGDVTEIGQRLEAAEERERGLRKALEEIARQKLHAEITDCDPDELDWLGGYEGCVKRARSAIAETVP